MADFGFLPPKNPIHQWIDPRRSALLGLGAGFLSGNPGQAAQGAMQGMQYDQQRTEKLAQQQQQTGQYNATKEWLKSKGREDLVPLVDAGQGAAALQMATQVPKGQDPFTLGAGQTRYDANGAVIASAPKDQYYYLTKEEISSMPGLDPTKAYQVGPDNKIYQVGGGGVTVNTGDNTSKFNNKADELAAARLSDTVSAGSSAQQFLGDIQTLAQLGTQINTGKGAEITNALGPYAQAVGVNIEGLGATQAYKSIIDRMAPQMRPPGAGSSSDKDVAMFLNGLPSLGRTPEGNQIITATLSAIQQSKIIAAEIASKALSGEITWQEADKKIRQIGNPYQAFNDYVKRMGPPGSLSQQPTSGAARTITQDEYPSLPSGTPFIAADDPTRTIRVKP